MEKLHLSFLAKLLILTLFPAYPSSLLMFNARLKLCIERKEERMRRGKTTWCTVLFSCLLSVFLFRLCNILQSHFEEARDYWNRLQQRNVLKLVSTVLFAKRPTKFWQRSGQEGQNPPASAVCDLINFSLLVKKCFTLTNLPEAKWINLLKRV